MTSNMSSSDFEVKKSVFKTIPPDGDKRCVSQLSSLSITCFLKAKHTLSLYVQGLDEMEQPPRITLALIILDTIGVL